jgi:hypothetical protein
MSAPFPSSDPVAILTKFGVSVVNEKHPDQLLQLLQEFIDRTRHQYVVPAVNPE